MNRTKLATILFILTALFLAACNASPPLPTQVPLASLPTATATGLPATRDLTAEAPTPQPTEPPPTPRPSATPLPVDVWIKVTNPEEGADLVVGSDVSIRGLVQKEPTHSVWLSLISATGHLLTEVEARVGETSWEAGFHVPQSVTGTAFLNAVVRDEDGDILAENNLRINLVLNADIVDRFVVFAQPTYGETAVSEFNILFSGQTKLPAGNRVTIEIWENCKEPVARQTFIMGRSRNAFPWQGFVVVPKDLVGRACAVATFGTIGEDNWREAQTVIDVLPQDHPEAYGVALGYPPPDTTIPAGEAFPLYGTALNVREGPVTVSVVLDNGRMVGQSTTTTDYWGYWETQVTLPYETLGAAKVSVSVGEQTQGNYAETETLITISEANTPTPVPLLPTATPSE
ncbi:MAG: hypothetical protein CSA11_04495 [Chloroflexi bacterium]|nr:MAG: hypothetical protein CSA11_04495 [Chloroflexota bacterium]